MAACLPNIDRECGCPYYGLIFLHAAKLINKNQNAVTKLWISIIIFIFVELQDNTYCCLQWDKLVITKEQIAIVTL